MTVPLGLDLNTDINSWKGQLNEGGGRELLSILNMQSFLTLSALNALCAELRFLLSKSDSPQRNWLQLAALVEPSVSGRLKLLSSAKGAKRHQQPP